MIVGPGASAWLDGLTERPSVTPAATRTHTAEFKRQTGPMSMYALVTLHVAPLPGHSGVLVDNLAAADHLPPEYLGGVIAGVTDHAEGSDERPTVGGLRVVILDARHHVIDSNEMAFRIATRLCLKEIFEHVGLVTWEPGDPAPLEPTDSLGERVGARLVEASEQVVDAVNAVIADDGFVPHSDLQLVREVDDVVQVAIWQGSAPTVWSGVGLRLGLVLPAVSAFFDFDEPLDEPTRFPNNHLGHPLSGLVSSPTRWWPVEDTQNTIADLTEAWRTAGREYFEQPRLRSCAGLLEYAEGERTEPRFYIPDMLQVGLIWHCRGADAALAYLDGVMVPKEADMPWTFKENVTLRRRIEHLADSPD